MDFISLDNQLIKILASLTVFLIMLTLGVDLSLSNLFAFWRNSSLLWRSLLATVILPLVVVLLSLLVVQVPDSFKIALALLVAVPGPPLLVRRAVQAGGEFHYTANLLMTLALSCLIVSPLVLELFHLMFPEITQKIHPLEVLKQISLVQFFPISIGLTIRKIWPKSVNKISIFLKKISNILFLILTIFLVVLSIKIIGSTSLSSILLSVVLVPVGLAVGHFLAPEDPRIKASLATATIARNAGLAIYIAVSNQRSEVIPSILAALILGVAFALPYSIWMKRTNSEIFSQ